MPVKDGDSCEIQRYFRGLILLFVLITSVAGSQIVGGQELEPRTYANIPVDMNFLAVGYAHSKGNILLDPSLPIEDLNAETDYAYLRYTRSLGLFNRIAKLKVMLPYAWGQYEGSVEGVSADRNISGIGDATLGLDISVMGAPALSGNAFSQYHQKTIVGASVRVGAPTGNYDNTKIINIGSNRWAFKGELGASRQLGNWTLELAGAFFAFTDNTDFLDGRTLSQAPLYSIKAHAIYTFKPGLWLGVGAGYGEGGQTTIEGNKRDTYQRNVRLGGVLSYPIGKNHGLNLVLLTGVRKGRGSDFDSLGAAYQYAWGGD